MKFQIVLFFGMQVMTKFCEFPPVFGEVAALLLVIVLRGTYLSAKKTIAKFGNNVMQIEPFFSNKLIIIILGRISNEITNWIIPVQQTKRIFLLEVKQNKSNKIKLNNYSTSREIDTTRAHTYRQREQRQLFFHFHVSQTRSSYQQIVHFIVCKKKREKINGGPLFSLFFPISNSKRIVKELVNVDRV